MVLAVSEILVVIVVDVGIEGVLVLDVLVSGVGIVDDVLILAVLVVSIADDCLGGDGRAD